MNRFLAVAVPIVVLALMPAPNCPAAPMTFTHHFVDQAKDAAGGSWGQTALADLDGDGDLDFVTARSRGPVLCYEYVAPDKWERHQIGDKSPSEVGGAVADLNKDGRPDMILGGVWLENPGKKTGEPWPRHTFDEKLAAVHDLLVAEIDGDDGLEVVTMSDQNNIRWYDIPADPKQPWAATAIGKPVHAGLAVGDLDGDGDTDIVRSSAWFENQDKGRKWIEHRLHDKPWPVAQGAFHDSTRSAVVDIDKDGRNEVILTVGEVVDSKVAVMEPPADPKSGPWTMNILPQSTEKRAPYHSIAIADFDNDGDLDIFTGEMEWIPGAASPRSCIWENLGKGEFKEQVIFDKNLGVHEAVAGDVDKDGDIDIVSKPWNAHKKNALGGGHHVDFLENKLK